MPREKQESLSSDEREKLLEILETVGKTRWSERWKNHMAIPENLNVFSKSEDDKEKILRYLLLRVLINQQAKFEKVREMSIRISSEFTDMLLYEPFRISESDLFRIFKDVAGEKGSLLYRVGALGGIKPISLFTYRFKAYEGFIKWLNERNEKLYDIILRYLREERPVGLFKFLNSHPVLEAGWVGNDPKACRMFVNWVVFLLSEVWDETASSMRDTLMIVDGHVAKVFCRTGLLEEVMYEKRRPYIIQANKMRPWIEGLVLNSGRVPFYVDNGAFYLFEDGYCMDIEPACASCPAGEVCRKYIMDSIPDVEGVEKFRRLGYSGEGSGHLCAAIREQRAPHRQHRGLTPAG
ncbi:MAG: hypothetical protein GXN98_02315 [Euryarchaeota archaeon]|nr:hypothetical protein [Euryarchaeota archaeon]